MNKNVLICLSITHETQFKLLMILTEPLFVHSIQAVPHLYPVVFKFTYRGNFSPSPFEIEYP